LNLSISFFLSGCIVIDPDVLFVVVLVDVLVDVFVDVFVDVVVLIGMFGLCDSLCPLISILEVPAFV
jgi:hypothetical protein